MKKKVLSLLLTLTMLLSTIPVSAETVQTITEESLDVSTPSVELSLHKGATFAVSLPKSIQIEEDTDNLIKAGIYLDADVNQILIVEPEITTLTLSNVVSGGEVKDDITADITVLKSTWNMKSTDLCDNIVDITANSNLIDICSISLTEEIPTGEWVGSLPIRIALEEDNTFSIDITDGNIDLNGKGIVIEGETADNLLNELVAQGYVESAEDISIVINVDCDEFSDTATATFNVKSFATVGDRIVIYHYDDELGVWEYIDTVTVNGDGTITCEFSSFSPVGLSNIGKVEEGHIHNYTESVIKDFTCTEDGVEKFICDCGDIYTEMVDARHLPGTDYYCTVCGKLVAGLYDIDDNLICTWESAGMDAERDNTLGDIAVTAPRYVIREIYPDTVTVVVPDGTTKIGDLAFWYCSSVKKIILPDSVEYIGDTAFTNCLSLENINVPTSLEFVGRSAFEGVPWFNIQAESGSMVIFNGKVLYWARNMSGDVVVPEGVVTISDYAFNSASQLTSITLPAGLKYIGERAFDHCNKLTNITIPATVNSIGKYAFNYCYNLNSVVFENPHYWYIGDTKGVPSASLDSASLSNKSTAATYLWTTYTDKYWTKQ